MKLSTLSLFSILLFALGLVVHAQDKPAFISEDVNFTNGDITLAGTLTLPDTAGPHPAAVVISGSGAQDRDGVTPGFLPGYEPLRFLAEGLTPAGIAVLRYDERGVGESTGKHNAASSRALASDAEAAIDYLKNRDDIDSSQVGLIGHSEGSNIVAMMGAEQDDLAFVISMAGQAVTGWDVLLAQTEAALVAADVPEEQIEAAVETVRQQYSLVLEEDWEQLEQISYAQFEAMPEDQRPSKEQQAQAIQQQLTNAQNWILPFLRNNPAEDWAEVKAPVLVVFAEFDTQVPLEQNRPPMAEALENGKSEAHTIVTLEDTNHLFQPDVKTGAPQEYPTLETRFTPELMPLLLDWILEQVATS